MDDALKAHLETGATTLCRAWRVVRADGTAMGFTDHDDVLEFGGLRYLAQSGLTARALQQSTGFAVDNSEALGALSEASIREEDIALGLYDGAEVTCWHVNWAEPHQRVVLFRGSFGEITRAQGAFRVELRGLTEGLNVPIGKVYHPACAAALGDIRCGFDLSQPGYRAEVTVAAFSSGHLLLEYTSDAPDGWFSGGRFSILSGAGKGQRATIRRDIAQAGQRRIELWGELSVQPAPGDVIAIEAGCDKRASTCREKFANFLNYRGFPHIPGEDWLQSNPQTRA